MTMSPFQLSSLIFVSTLLAGCGKDHTVDEYLAQKSKQEQRETNQSIAGTFTGPLYSKLNGQTMGILSVELSGDTEVSDGRSRNVIAANISLTTPTAVRTLSVSNGSYNIYNHSYQIDFMIPNAPGPDVKLRLVGVINPEAKVMEGSLQSVDFAKYGGTYRLTQDQKLPQPGRLELPAERAANIFGRVFSVRQEVYGFPNEIVLRLLPVVRSPEQEFLDLFYPVRFATVMFTLTETKGGQEVLTLAFENSVWDMDAKTLHGSVTRSSTGGTLPYHFTLQCSESGTSRVPGWNCDWSGRSVVHFNATAAP